MSVSDSDELELEEPFLDDNSPPSNDINDQLEDSGELELEGDSSTDQSDGGDELDLDGADSALEHRPAMEEMEESLGNFFLEDDVDHPRLQKIVEELESESEQQRIKATLHVLANDNSNSERSLREALLYQLCTLRANMGIEIAALQIHTIGIYRSIKKAVHRRSKYNTNIDELRAIKCKYLHSFLDPDSFEFANPTHMEGIVQIPGLVQYMHEESKRIRSFSKHGHWEDEELGNFLPREKELKIFDLPEHEREAARTNLVSDHVRSYFYRKLFLEYFDIDTFDPRDAEHYTTIFDWLLAIEETPHLFPFMQGQQEAQKHFRLAHLLNKIVQISELYQRIEKAKNDEFDDDTAEQVRAATNSREAIKALAINRYPPLRISRSFIGSTLLCPFASFAKWVQDKVSNNDFTLPPEPKKKKTEDS